MDWGSSSLESDGGFTLFLGRFFPSESVTKNFARIPAQTELLKVEFDFYEIDQWFGNNLVVSIGRETIDFGKFLPDVDEGRHTGTTVDCGITWVMESQGPPRQIGFDEIPDQIHHAVAIVPADCYDNFFGSVKIGILTTGLFGGRGGIDNLRIVAQYPCENAPAQTPNTNPVAANPERPFIPPTFDGGEAVAAAPQGGTMTFEPHPVEKAPDTGTEMVPATPQGGTMTFVPY